MREVERLARREVFLDRRPYGDLPGVGEQVLDDRCAPGGLFDPEERLARYPAVGDGLVPAFRAFALSDDDVEPVVLEVERLPRPLYAVADYGVVSSLRTSRAFSRGNSSRVTTFSSTPPKLICAIVV